MAEIEIVQGPILRERFEETRTQIKNASSDGLLGVFHIGSTAVPELATKPMVDVLAVYDGYKPAWKAADTLVTKGYTIQKDEPEWIQLIRSESEDVGFIHFRPKEPEVWRDQLVLREYLRENPKARREYEQAKLSAAEEHPNSPEEYTAAKMKSYALSKTVRTKKDTTPTFQT